jgi:hypothetical protein
LIAKQLSKHSTNLEDNQGNILLLKLLLTLRTSKDENKWISQWAGALAMKESQGMKR